MNCENCNVMKILEELQWRLSKGDDILEALDGAIRSQVQQKETLKNVNLASAGCMQVGCSAIIRYDSDAKERPLYCQKHMKGHEGRNMMKIRKSVETKLGGS